MNARTLLYLLLFLNASAWAAETPVGPTQNTPTASTFDEEGIDIPFPHRTVYFGEPKEGMAPSMPLTFAEKEESCWRGWRERRPN